MGNKRKPPSSSGSKAGSSSGSAKHAAPGGTSYTSIGLLAVGGLLAALAVQVSLTGSAPASPQPTQPTQAAAPTKPAVCPDDWSECPNVGGIDWLALAELEASLAMPSVEAIESCLGPTPLLSSRAVRGMHLLCVLPPPASSEGVVAATLAVFKEMVAQPSPSDVMLLPAGLTDATDVVKVLSYKMGFPKKRARYQPPALFTERGVRLVRAAAALGQRPEVHRLLCLEGGQWLWPPVEVGHAHVLPNLTAPGVDTRVVTLSFKPLVVEVENFLSPGESVHIINRAKPHMAKSGVALKDADKGKAAKEFRTSSQYFLPTTKDKMLEKIDRRVSQLTRIPISHAEYIQVLKYEHLEHYSAHHDFFDPAAYASNKEMLASVEHGAKNRLATVFFYLNNVTSESDLSVGGGQTNFPRAATAEYPDGGPLVHDYFDCSRGLSVYPQEGKVIIFYSMLPNGEMDDFSLHGGCDVLDQTATKWSANFWLWNKPYHFNDPARKRTTLKMEASWL